MIRQPYFPRIICERPEWFRNFREELPIANAILAMPAADVTNRSADALHLEHASGIYLTKVREFGTAYTAFLDRAYYGTETDPLCATLGVSQKFLTFLASILEFSLAAFSGSSLRIDKSTDSHWPRCASPSYPRSPSGAWQVIPSPA